MLGPDLTTGLGADVVAAPVDLDSDVGRLVVAGDRVELLAVPRPDTVDAPVRPAGAVVVVDRARVLAVFAPAVADVQVDGATGGTQLVVAVTRPLAVRIATLRTSHVFAVVADDP